MGDNIHYQEISSTDDLPPRDTSKRELLDLYARGRLKSIDTVRSSISDDDEDEIKELCVNVEEPLNDDENWNEKKSDSSRRYARLCVIAGSIIAVIWVITLLSYLLAGSVSKARLKNEKNIKNPVTFENIMDRKFGSRVANVEWISEAGDGFFSQRESSNDIYIENVETKERKLLVKGNDLRLADGKILSYTTFRVSADMKYILFSSNHVKRWRHSFTAFYFVYDLANNTLTELGKSESEPSIAYAKWSPSGHSIAYVEDNDIYVLPDLRTQMRVTQDGTDNVFNGVPDWVYEEEVLTNNYALWWSPDSQRIAYLRFNETTVPEYKIPIYVNDDYNAKSYPDEVVMKYPKAGYDNPIVTVHVFSIEDALHSAPSVIQVVYDGEFEQKDRLITEVVWAGSNQLLVRQTNRVSDVMKLVLYDVETKMSHVVRSYNATELDGGWFEVTQNIRYISPSPSCQAGCYIDTVIHDGNMHLALFSPVNSTEPTVYLTSGDWEVVGGVQGLRLSTETVYYLSTEKSSIERHLYSVDLRGKRRKALTDTSNQGFYSTSFSPEAGYYLLNYQGPDIPHQAIYKVDNEDFKVVLEDNQELKNISKEYALPEIRYSTISSDGYKLNAMEIVPPGFDESGTKKYPVLFRVYGGPGSQLVTTTYSPDWHWFITSSPERQYIVVIVDGRGTGLKGRKFRVCVRGNLGYFETIDQIAAAKNWAKRAYVDPHRMGIWGWSYGGFMAAKSIEANAGVYKFGISVAPVVDWRFYDSIYTERYMKTPQENSGGYANSSVHSMEGFKHSNFLLIHGSGDDNVHYQNSALLVDRLTLDQVNFQMRVFTDSDHNINRHNAMRGIYHLLTDFVDSQFATHDKEEKLEYKVS